MIDVLKTAQILREARIRKNMTQSALAEEIGVTYQAVSNWERGNTLPDIANIGAICAILGLEVQDVIGVPADLKEASPENIAEAAPVIPPDELIEALRLKIGALSDLTSLAAAAPFVSREFLEETGRDLVPSSVNEVIALAPFVSQKMCGLWADRLKSTGEPGQAEALLPFLDREAAERLLKKRTDQAICPADKS